MGIWKWIKSAFTTVEKTVDELHYSGEEKDKLKNELAKIQADLSVKYVELESELIKARVEISKAEAASDSWWQKAWRPMCSMLLVTLVTAQCMVTWIWGIPISPELFTFAASFLGITSFGRGIEKAARANKLGK